MLDKMNCEDCDPRLGCDCGKADCDQRSGLNWHTPLAPLPCKEACPVSCPIPKKKEKPMQNMHMDVAVVAQSPGETETEGQRRFLLDRLETAYYANKDKLAELFNLNDMETPKTPKEMADRLAKGLFVVKKLDKAPDEEFSYHGWYSFLKWRDPAKPADQAGADAAKKLLKVAKADAELIIRIQAPAESVATLKAFEAWTPTAV